MRNGTWRADASARTLGEAALRGHNLLSCVPTGTGSQDAVRSPRLAAWRKSFPGASLCLLLCLAFILAPFHPLKPGASGQTAVAGEQIICVTSARAEHDSPLSFTPACCLPADRPEPRAFSNDACRVSFPAGCRFWLLHARESMRHILLM